MLQVKFQVILGIKSLQTVYISHRDVDFLDHSCPKDVITVTQSMLWSNMNMILISGANTNVTFQIQVHVHLTGKCLLRYTEVVFHFMETDLHTFCCQGKCNCFFIPISYNLIFLCILCTGDTY